MFSHRRSGQFTKQNSNLLLMWSISYMNNLNFSKKICQISINCYIQYMALNKRIPSLSDLP